ncbi:hypothetical protein BCR44DRAFT_1428733, partial [Catenaria anguillulae PL171]
MVNAITMMSADPMNQSQTPNQPITVGAALGLDTSAAATSPASPKSPMSPLSHTHAQAQVPAQSQSQSQATPGSPAAAAAVQPPSRTGSTTTPAGPGAAPAAKPMGVRLERCRQCKDVFGCQLDLRSSDLFTDIELVLPSGHRLRAHKLVLATASPVLRARLSEQPDITSLDLKDFLLVDPHNVAPAVVDFMYSRQAVVHAGNVLGMTRAARDLGIVDLFQLSSGILSRFVVADPHAMLPTAVQFNLHDLTAQIVDVLLAPGRTLDQRTWDALAHLPAAQFSALLASPQCPLTPNQRFEAVRAFVDRNAESGDHRKCLIHPDAPPASPSGQVESDLCICSSIRPLTPEEIRAIWTVVDFSALEPDVLSMAFTMKHVPQDLVFGAVMSKLMQMQSSAASIHSATSPAPSHVVQHPHHPQPQVQQQPQQQPQATGNMSQAEQMAFVASTLSRMKLAQQQQQQQQQQPSVDPKPMPPTPMSHPPQPPQPASPTASNHPQPLPLNQIRTVPQQTDSMYSPHATPQARPAPTPVVVQVQTQQQAGHNQYVPPQQQQASHANANANANGGVWTPQGFPQQQQQQQAPAHPSGPPPAQQQHQYAQQQQ